MFKKFVLWSLAQIEKLKDELNKDNLSSLLILLNK